MWEIGRNDNLATIPQDRLNSCLVFLELDPITSPVVRILHLISELQILDLPLDNHDTRYQEQRRSKAMDDLSAEGRTLYDLLKGSIIDDVGKRVHD